MNFNDFYHLYLAEHSHQVCRRLHFLGMCLMISCMILFFFTGKFSLLLIGPGCAIVCSTLGHGVFQKRVPKTFRHPLFTLAADFKLFWEILSGQVTAF